MMCDRLEDRGLLVEKRMISALGCIWLCDRLEDRWLHVEKRMISALGCITASRGTYNSYIYCLYILYGKSPDTFRSVFLWICGLRGRFGNTRHARCLCEDWTICDPGMLVEAKLGWYWYSGRAPGEREQPWGAGNSCNPVITGPVRPGDLPVR